MNPRQLYFFGRSLGGAVAIHLAAQNPDKVWIDAREICKRV